MELYEKGKNCGTRSSTGNNELKNKHYFMWLDRDVCLHSDVDSQCSYVCIACDVGLF